MCVCRCGVCHICKANVRDVTSDNGLLIIYVTDCRQALGMENNMIADDQITASSEWFRFVNPAYHGANNARLNRPSQSGSVGAWCSLTQDLNQWIQVDLMTPTWVTGVRIQGREDLDQ